MAKLDPDKMKWRVSWKVPGENHARRIYNGTGEDGRLIAMKKYETAKRKRGIITLHCGIFPIKSRAAQGDDDK